MRAGRVDKGLQAEMPIGIGRSSAVSKKDTSSNAAGDQFTKTTAKSAFVVSGTTIPAGDLEGLAKNMHFDPHSVLGPHPVKVNGAPATAVRALFPGRDEVTLVVKDPKEGPKQIPMKKVHDSGIFEAVIPGQKKKLDYKLQLTESDGTKKRVEDPFRFPVSVDEMDLWLFNEGSLENTGELLGAHEKVVDGVKGFNFVVWAPNAKRISVVGEFNEWEGKQHPMRRLGDSGVWEIFIPGVEGGMKYDLEVHDAKGKISRRADPAGQQFEIRPGTSSVTVGKSSHTWKDAEWIKARASSKPLEMPMSTYELHLPSWQKKDSKFMNYRDLADELVPYLQEKGFTHVELMGLLEHPLDMSWGYQVTGYFAPTSRHGSPEDFKYFVDKLHQAGVGIIMDWVPAHFPKNTTQGIADFDGTSLFDHHDSKQGEHKDWGTRIFNYDRNEVRSFLIGSMMHMLKEYHLDGLRVDAVASMLYLDYSKKDGEWVANKHGGNENLDAIEFMKKFNAKIDAKLPGVISVAEESTAWPGVTKSGGDKALGFDLKWNMGWMNDTLHWFHTPHEHRGQNMDQLTNTFLWSQAEKYVCALSHDEVVYGKGSLWDKMPGDEWQKFANLRLLLGYMWSYPGHKLLFMGGEFGQKKEWDYQEPLDWQSLQDPKHQGVSKLLGDLNKLYKNEPALYEKQFDPSGMELSFRDTTNAVLGISRKGKDSKNDVLFVHNTTQYPRMKYRIGVDAPGAYKEIFNSDSAEYGGSNMGNMGKVVAEEKPFHGKPYSIEVTLPPLGTIAFKRAE
jgi:1,4-alpha-glucan branching enzyme